MRDAYRASVAKNLKGGGAPTIQGELPTGASQDPLHVLGLFEALTSRYWASGVSREQIEQRAASGYLWIELMPFLFLDDEDAVEVLAEYVLWKEANEELLEYMRRGADGPYPEWTSSVRQDWLKARVLKAVHRMEEADPPIEWLDEARNDAARLADGDSPSIPWLEFLREEPPTDAASVFEQESGWNRLPAPLLSALSERLENAYDAEWFMSVAERSGICERFLKWAEDATGGDPAYGLTMLATMLTSYANGLGDRGDMTGARGALRLALILSPSHVPAWSSMAIAHVNSGNCEEAVYWARRVLDCDPKELEGPVGPPGSGMVGLLASGEREAARGLDDPSLVGAWQRVKETMEYIIERCGE